MLIILDDDPTGTQTTRGLPILTEWSVESLRAEFEGRGDALFILTNSRALPEPAAAALNREIADNLKKAASGRPFSLVSRGDSTLRGHFPLETDVLSEELGPFDATILAPFFDAGGRVTISDVHYVKEAGTLTPVAETPFAKDATFGFASSNLRDYIEEKSSGRIPANGVQSLSLDFLRSSSAAAIAEAMLSWPKACHAIINSERASDLSAFTRGLKIAEASGRRYLFRTAAEFVASYLGQQPGQLLEASELELDASLGGVIIVGSHVPKSSAQLQQLLATGIRSAEMDVSRLLDDTQREEAISEVRRKVTDAIDTGNAIVVYTSRQRVDGKDGDSSLNIASKVSAGLVELVAKLKTRPRYLVAKGGITSSDLATKGLGIRRAMVAGQILPGVPLWHAGKESLFPRLPYIVFPGNVGPDDALVQLTKKLNY